MSQFWQKIKDFFLGVKSVPVVPIVEPAKPKPVENDGEVFKPSSYKELYRNYGDPETRSFESDYIAFCETPMEMKCFPLRDGKRGFRCHKLLVKKFQSVFNELVAIGVDQLIKTYDGCWVVRKITGSSSGNLSLHSWGIAIDLNADLGNSFGDSTPAMDKRVVAVFKKHGFFWGGDYHGNKDGMHFEYYSR